MYVYVYTVTLITGFFASKVRKMLFANMTNLSIRMKTLQREWLCFKAELQTSCARLHGKHCTTTDLSTNESFQ